MVNAVECCTLMWSADIVLCCLFLSFAFTKTFLEPQFTEPLKVLSTETFHRLHNPQDKNRAGSTGGPWVQPDPAMVFYQPRSDL